MTLVMAGFVVAIAEMCIASGLGLRGQLPYDSPRITAFVNHPAHYVVEISKGDVSTAVKELSTGEAIVHPSR